MRVDEGGAFAKPGKFFETLANVILCNIRMQSQKFKIIVREKFKY